MRHPLQGLRAIRTAWTACLAVAAMALIGAGDALAAAAARDVFTVARVPVEANAADATTAKAAALRSGRREAIEILLRRLTQRTDWAYLPGSTVAPPEENFSADYLASLSGEGPGPDAPPEPPKRQRISLSDAQIDRLVRGFEVFNEKARGAIYRAEVTYLFNADAIRNILKASHIPYSEVQSRLGIVLPVLQTKDGLSLWGDDNPWLAAWRKQTLAHELTPIAAPLGDLADIGLVRAEEALGLDQEALSQIAERYGVERVYLAHGDLRQSRGQDQLRVRFLEAYSADAAEGGYGAVIADSRFSMASGAFDKLAERAVDSVFGDYAEQWKARTLIDHSAAQRIVATAYFGDMDEWLGIRRALTETPIVEGVQVAALSPDGAYLTLVFLGSAEQLRVALEQNDFTVWSDDGVLWNIASKARAQDLKENTERGRGEFRRWSDLNAGSRGEN
ncbi:MAG: DUF2066 domain-containing protein [Pseudomonadota bacterium]